MSTVRVELAYRVRRWQSVFVLLLMAAGIAGAVVLGIYLYGGGNLGVKNGVGAVLRGKMGAAIAWSFAGIAVVVELLAIVSWIFIMRQRPRVVLEPDAVIVPSKWRMRPVRITLESITGVVWSKKGFGKVGYVWLHHQGGKAVILEDLLEKGDAQLIVDWVEERRPGHGNGSTT